jgi:beta-1,4-mannosyl-glycoprotein beta-1,4-N-acetylglucosaminyltransferase
MSATAPSTSRKIIDGFIFYNELELLSYRLKVLNDLVDYFVIVESTHTFVGKEKPLIFRDNAAQYAEYSHKIIHIIVDDMPYIHPNINIRAGQQWKNEEWQRNAIATGFAKVCGELCESDILMITDLDEIPDPNTLRSIKYGGEGEGEGEGTGASELLAKPGICILGMDLYYYNLHVKYTQKCDWPKILTYRAYQKMNTTCSLIRGITACPRIAEGGWHLSYFGDYEFMKNKTENWSHQELNNSDTTDIANIADRVNRGVDLYNRSYVSFHKIPIKDNKYLPVDYDKYLTKYYTE